MLSFQRADAIQAKSPALSLLRCFEFNCVDKALEEVGDVFWKFAARKLGSITRKLPSRVPPSDYYPSLLFHVGSDEAATHSPRAIERYFRALGQ